MKEIKLNIHPDQDKMKKEVLEIISKLPTSSDDKTVISMDELTNICTGFYLKGFDLGVLETVKKIANNPDVTEYQFHLDLPV